MSWTKHFKSLNQAIQITNKEQLFKISRHLNVNPATKGIACKNASFFKAWAARKRSKVTGDYKISCCGHYRFIRAGLCRLNWNEIWLNQSTTRHSIRIDLSSPAKASFPFPSQTLQRLSFLWSRTVWKGKKTESKICTDNLQTDQEPRRVKSLSNLQNKNRTIWRARCGPSKGIARHAMASGWRSSNQCRAKDYRRCVLVHLSSWSREPYSSVSVSIAGTGRKEGKGRRARSRNPKVYGPDWAV
jgi:hypothetical protein